MTSPTATRMAALTAALVLGAFAVMLPILRRTLIHDLVTYDAPPSAPARLPRGDGAGLSPSPHVRVLLIDGLSADVADTLPALSAACARGVKLVVDVGFPTVSLPVEVALWTGLTQQQTGVVYRSDRAIEPPLRASIPAKVAGSRAIAEDHPYIVRSLGFAQVEPAAGDGRDAAWAAQFPTAATAAVASGARLVFVHVLRVDNAGHHFGGASPEYRAAATEADALARTLLAADPSARWFLLSDHGHLPAGGHGGDERAVRQVDGCIIGAGLAPAVGGPVHVVDIARAIADSLGVTLDPASLARPLGAALVLPLGPDQAVPPLALTTGAIAIAILVAGIVLTAWTTRRWWLAPWWFAVAIAALIVLRGLPTLSTAMMYAPAGQLMYVTWLPAVAIAALTAALGMRRVGVVHAVIAQLALPIAATAAVLTASGAWPGVLGEQVAAAVPRYTAWSSPLLLMTAHGAAAVALAALATLALPTSDRPSPPAPPRTARAIA